MDRWGRESTGSAFPGDPVSDCLAGPAGLLGNILSRDHVLHDPRHRKPGALAVVDRRQDRIGSVAGLTREHDGSAVLITGELAIATYGVQPLGGIFQIADRPDLKLEPVGAHAPSSSFRASALAACCRIFRRI